MASRAALIPLAVLAIGAIGGGAALWLGRGSPEPAVDPYVVARDCPEPDQVQSEGKVFCPGTPVEAFKFAGIVSVEQGGRSYRAVVDGGRSGTVVGHAPSPVDGSPSVARILWAPQDWPLEDGGTATLAAFESTAHADHLRLRR